MRDNHSHREPIAVGVKHVFATAYHQSCVRESLVQVVVEAEGRVIIAVVVGWLGVLDACYGSGYT